jgi:hypothetical protein
MAGGWTCWVRAWLWGIVGNKTLLCKWAAADVWVPGSTWRDPLNTGGHREWECTGSMSGRWGEVITWPKPGPRGHVLWVHRPGRAPAEVFTHTHTHTLFSVSLHCHCWVTVHHGPEETMQLLEWGRHSAMSFQIPALKSDAVVTVRDKSIKNPPVHRADIV